MLGGKLQNNFAQFEWECQEGISSLLLRVIIMLRYLGIKYLLGILGSNDWDLGLSHHLAIDGLVEGGIVKRHHHLVTGSLVEDYLLIHLVISKLVEDSISVAGHSDGTIVSMVHIVERIIRAFVWVIEIEIDEL